LTGDYRNPAASVSGACDATAAHELIGRHAEHAGPIVLADDEPDACQHAVDISDHISAWPLDACDYPVDWSDKDIGRSFALPTLGVELCVEHGVRLHRRDLNAGSSWRAR
jgi:hypothetical protein